MEDIPQWVMDVRGIGSMIMADFDLVSEAEFVVLVAKQHNRYVGSLARLPGYNLGKSWQLRPFIRQYYGLPPRDAELNADERNFVLTHLELIIASNNTQDYKLQFARIQKNVCAKILLSMKNPADKKVTDFAKIFTDLKIILSEVERKNSIYSLQSRIGYFKLYASETNSKRILFRLLPFYSGESWDTAFAQVCVSLWTTLIGKPVTTVHDLLISSD